MIKSICNRMVLWLICRKRVGTAHGIGLSNLRDRDGRFYRAAYGAIDLISQYAPFHLKKLQREFDWIVNRKLASGEGSTWTLREHRICTLSMMDFNDDLVTQAFLATALVEESIRSRFRHLINLGDEERLLSILRRIDRHVIRFARRLNGVGPDIGTIIANSIEKRTTMERMVWLFLNDGHQLMFEVRDLRRKRIQELKL